MLKKVKLAFSCEKTSISRFEVPFAERKGFILIFEEKSIVSADFKFKRVPFLDKKQPSMDVKIKNFLDTKNKACSLTLKDIILD